MRLLIITFLSIIPFGIFAQPDPKDIAPITFFNLSEELKETPNNYVLISKRIHLTELHYIHYELSKNYEGRLMDKFFPYEDQNQLLEDLNTLISNNAIIETQYYCYNIAYFKMLRGRFHYFSGKKEMALTDYLSALCYNDSMYTNPKIKENIYVCIAEYYYSNKPFTKKDKELALKYIYLAFPKTFVFFSEDYFESEKKELLKSLNMTEKLTTYYQELVVAQYDNFTSSKSESRYGEGFIYSLEQYYRTLMRIHELVEHFRTIGERQKSRVLEKKMLELLPPNSKGKPYIRFPRKNFYLWLDEYKHNTPVDKWQNKNKGDVYQHFQKMQEFISDIASEI